jgi:hypothetical protein
VLAKLTCFSALAGGFNTLVKGKSRGLRRDIALENADQPKLVRGPCQLLEISATTARCNPNVEMNLASAIAQQV